MFVSKKRYAEMERQNEILQYELNHAQIKMKNLQNRIEGLKKVIPYEEYLKTLGMTSLRDIAVGEYAISERVLAECDNKADWIREILRAKKELDMIKPKGEKECQTN